jgi:hypothetical protein
MTERLRMLGDKRGLDWQLMVKDWIDERLGKEARIDLLMEDE